MSIDWPNTVAIILMGIATYACRGGGYWLFRQIRPSPLIRAMLAYVPGTLFVSFVVPSLIQGGWQALAGGAAPPACVTMAMGPSFFSVLGDR